MSHYSLIAFDNRVRIRSCFHKCRPKQSKNNLKLNVNYEECLGRNKLLYILNLNSDHDSSREAFSVSIEGRRLRLPCTDLMKCCPSEDTSSRSTESTCLQVKQVS